MPYVAGREEVTFTFLNRHAGRSGPSPAASLKPVVVLAILLLSSFSISASMWFLPAPPGEEPPCPARSSTIVTSSFAISPKTAYVGDTVTFFANASSDFGSSLNFTIYYDYLLGDGVTVNPYSPVSYHTTGNPGSVVTTYVYNAPGNLSGAYRVLLRITDETGAFKDLPRAVTILAVENRAPYLLPDLPSTVDTEVGVPIEFSVTCWDLDDDDLTLTWDFGDGTDPVVQTTGPAAAGVECVQTHAWNPDPVLLYGLGDIDLVYYVNISLTDGKGYWVNQTCTVRVILPHNFSPKGNLSASARMVDPGDIVQIYGNASDVEGEPLTWTFLFSNSTEVFRTEVYHTGLTEPGETVYQNTSFTFAEPGDYSVTLYLSDLALPEMQTDPLYASHNISVGTVYISSVLNRVPYVLADITVIPQDVHLSELTGYAEAVFRIQANDADGEVLTVTWDFGDGSEQAVNVSLGGTQVYTFTQAHRFYASGQFKVSLVVTDGRPGHEVLRYKLVNVSSNNSAPEVKDFRVVLSNSSYGLPGSVVHFILVLFDLERDPIQVAWDFGDSSPVEWTNVTSFDESGYATCTIDHIYSAVGRYTVRINFTDGIYGLLGYHADTWSGLVVIAISSPDSARVWDWWDYTSLGLFWLSVGLLCMWAVMGSIKRSRLDKMGVTPEEYLLRKEELERYDERHRGKEGSI